ncbi:MAG: hypothetical protein NXI04_02295 [Planctomycetaceae bacterium]|nr:hypothetical protein [Planctomycetaceae bacterium]
MQGSFWKTVAVVGVIGIGTLVIVEVGNNLRQQTTETQNPPDADLESLVAGAQAGDQTVTPQAESDFDRLLAGQSPDFGGSEPGSDEPALPFFDGQEEPLAAAPVDTNVQLNDLVEGPNPFLADTAGTDDVTAVAANYQGGAAGPSGTPAQTVSQSNTVEPTAFIGDTGSGTRASDLSGGRFEPFQSGTDTPVMADTAAAGDPPDFEDFPSFQADDAPLFDPAAAADTGTAATAAVPAGSTDPLLFVNGENDVPAARSTGTTDPGPFYREDENTLQPTPDAGTRPAAATFPPEPEFESFGGGNTPLVEDVPATSEPVQPLLDFGGGTDPEPFPPVTDTTEPFTAEPFQPESFDRGPTTPQPFTRGDDRPAATPPADPAGRLPLDTFRDERGSVPVPRDLDTGGAVTVPDFNTGTAPAPAENPDGDLLPFTEDIPEEGRQPLDDPGRMSIPDFNPDPAPRSPAAREDIIPAPRTFDPLPQPEPRFDTDPGIEITPRPGSERRDLAPIPDFSEDRGFGRPSEIEIRPRDFDTPPRPIDDRLSLPVRPGEREFGSDSRTRPADFGADDRQGGVRNVAGVMRPNLVLQKSAPENATVGVPLDYKIFIRNEGDATAHDVVVEDEIPTGARVEGASPQSVRDRSTNNLIWKFAEVLPNETKEIVVRLVPTGEGTLDGVATVRFKSRVKATTVITAPKLRLEMAGPEETKMGQQVAYRYIVTNEGSGDAQNVFIRTLLPQEGGLKHPAGRDLEYEIGTLPAGQQREIVLAVVASEAGDYTAQAEVTGSGGAKDQAAWRTNIIGAQLQIIRRGPKRRFVGRTATYENIVSNETNFDAVDAQVSEFVPEGMKFVSANKGGQYDPATRTVVWRINRLAPDRQELLQIELRPETAGNLESVVTVFENAGIQSDDYVSTTVVQDLHNVGARMSQLDGPVAVGESFGFAITIDNRGTADATDVRLVIDVPRQIKVDRAGSRTLSATLDPTTNQVQYQIVKRIEPNQQSVFELKLTGQQPIENGLVKASVQYRQMEEPLVVSESVTVYRDDL